jgi:RNA polymerase sigma factor (sigma-70 family)
VTGDEDALAAQAAGNPDSFTKLYNLWFPRVFNYIQYRSSEPGDVEDLTMHVFLKLLKNINRYDPNKGPFGAWLFSIARNVLTDYHRARRVPWLPLASFREKPDPVRRLEDNYARSQDQIQLVEALVKLNERERDVLGLKFGARLNNRQIADLVGLSESNVGVIIYRSLNKLRAVLNIDGTSD